MITCIPRMGMPYARVRCQATVSLQSPSLIYGWGQNFYTHVPLSPSSILLSFLLLAQGWRGERAIWPSSSITPVPTHQPGPVDLDRALLPEQRADPCSEVPQEREFKGHLSSVSVSKGP